MINGILQLISILANVACFGYLLYQAGKLKGLSIAVSAALNRKKESSND